ncbi:MAG: tRNA lysidine(34) synthetase TilS [Calditrichia bacterium]|nr:tRNA lysidine(34) synthetase TilS [Calditrichia bacterium]
MNINKENFLQSIKKHNLIDNGKKIVIAFSGGPDSMALLHLLYSIKNALKLELLALYVDHGLRERKIDDYKILEHIKENYPNIAVYTEKINVKQFYKEKNYSLEEAGRVLRYEVLEKKCADLNYDYIATGHHQDDFAETILMHLVEGSGPSGLAGIRLHYKNIIRPLLFFRKNSILKYCRENNLPFSVDETNEHLKFKRNSIRHKLLPFIEKEFQPTIVKKLFQTGLIFQQEEKYLNEKLGNISFKKSYNYILIKENEVLSLSPWGIKKFLEEIVFPEMGINKVTGFNKFMELFSYIKNNYHKRIKITDNFFMKREQENIMFYKKIFWNPVSILPDKHQYNIEEPVINFQTNVHSSKNEKENVINEINKLKKGKTKNIASLYLNYDKLSWPLTIRQIEKADTFIPLGLNYPVKVKRYLKDKNISEATSSIFPVIVNSDDQIVGLPGLLPGNKFNVNEKTNKIFEIKFFSFFLFFI